MEIPTFLITYNLFYSIVVTVIIGNLLIQNYVSLLLSFNTTILILETLVLGGFKFRDETVNGRYI